MMPGASFDSRSECLVDEFLRQGWGTVGLPVVERSRLVSASLDFFRQPLRDKCRYVRGVTGYTPYGAEHGGDPGRPDMLESYVSNLDVLTEPEAHALDQALFAARKDLTRTLWRVVEEVLATVAHADDHLGVGDFEAFVQVNYFPPVSEVPVTAAGNMRMAAHEDPGLVTVFPTSASLGFEFLTHDGSWGTLPGCTMVSAFPGLLMARLTGDHVPALVHRVRLPDDPRDARVSIAVTAWPKRETNLRTLSRFRTGLHPTWTATGANWMTRFLEAYMTGDRFRLY